LIKTRNISVGANGMASDGVVGGCTSFGIPSLVCRNKTCGLLYISVPQTQQQPKKLDLLPPKEP
jgi:hypothetical protein